MSDTQAAQNLNPHDPSFNDSANTQANNTRPDPSQLAEFHANGAPWQQNVDGQCPTGLTTGEVLQWAANKWGLNPSLLYSEASVETGWNQAAAGDCVNGVCGSHGLLQVPDVASRPNHADNALAGLRLASESTCFNADYYAARLYATYHGEIQGQVTPPGNVAAAIQAWYQGPYGARGPGAYSAKVCGNLNNPTGHALRAQIDFGGGQGADFNPLGQAQDPQQAQQDPCIVNPNQLPNFPGIGGGGIAVSDAETEANTANIANQAAAIQENTDVLAQLTFQHCEAEEQAWRQNVNTATEPSAWDASQNVRESQAP